MNTKRPNLFSAGEPALVYEYTDPIEGFKGWYVRDRVCHRLCAGGMRVQKGLTREKLTGMARNMTRKMLIANLRVDGAKSGIDYDPAASGKAEAVARFLAAIKPYVEKSYSMGPDLNMEMDELEKIARKVGIPSVKMAVAYAQGWDLDYYLARSSILRQEIYGMPLSRLRAGYGLAAAVLAVLKTLDIESSQATVAIQGFGTLARAAALSLYNEGVNIIAIADIDKCLQAMQGKDLDIPKLMKASGPLLQVNDVQDIALKPSGAIAEVQCDVLVPAAVENSISQTIASSLQAKAVVPGANLAVPPESMDILYKRAIIILPDYIAGCGGSLSMEGLFAPDKHPDAAAVLNHIKNRMFNIVSRVLQISSHENVSPSVAADKICNEAECLPGKRPYGNPD